jgi:hypothetical protein
VIRSRALLAALLGGAAAGAIGGAPRASARARPADEPRLAPLSKPADPAPKLPDSIPEAIAKLLDPRGVRLTGGDGKPVCELWLRSEVPLSKKATSESRVQLVTIPFGTLIGALRVTGGMTDYRNQALAPGCYGLRIGWQPVDGNHLGTSDSRDFAVVTSFTRDKDPAPVAKLDDLVKLSVPASPSEHLVALYVAAPEGDPPKEGDARLFKRAGREEWAADQTLVGRTEGATETTKLRVALVLIGHVSE